MPLISYIIIFVRKKFFQIYSSIFSVKKNKNTTFGVWYIRRKDLKNGNNTWCDIDHADIGDGIPCCPGADHKNTGKEFRLFLEEHKLYVSADFHRPVVKRVRPV